MAHVITWRRARDGAWVVCGPAGVLESAAASREPVTVTKRDGSTVEVLVAHAGRRFDVDGEQCCYGYLAAAESAPAAAAAEPAGIWCAECRASVDGTHRVISDARPAMSVVGAPQRPHPSPFRPPAWSAGRRRVAARRAGHEALSRVSR